MDSHGTPGLGLLLFLGFLDWLGSFGFLGGILAWFARFLFGSGFAAENGVVAFGEIFGFCQANPDNAHKSILQGTK